MDTFEKLVVAVMVLVLIALVAALVQDNQNWQKFKVEHNCKVVGKTAGTWSTGISSSGSVVSVSTPGQTGWACDDGVTYWR